MKSTLTLANLFLCASVSFAQGVNPAPPSNSLNYLNLTRGGNPAVNYYGIVRPNLQNQNAWLSAQQQLSNLSQSNSSSNQQEGGIRPTGVGATFMNYGHYYPRLGGGGAGRAGAGQPPRR
jgi:hypothetical protein